MKNKLLVFYLVIVIVSFLSCKKENPDDNTGNNITPTDNYSSMFDFYLQNQTKYQVYKIDASSGGSFTTPSGTKVNIPKNAFINLKYKIVTGEVEIEFKDIYSKSEMVLNNITTKHISGEPLNSAGMFYIKATQENELLFLARGKSISVEQPSFGNPVDSDMKAFIWAEKDTTNGWVRPPVDSLSFPIDTVYLQAASYIFRMNQFTPSLDSGTWCNTDKYFMGMDRSILKLFPHEDPQKFSTNVFLLFNNASTVLPAERWSNEFSFNAPLGFNCDIVAIGVNDGKLFSYFSNVDIVKDMKINFTLTETTTEDFKKQLEALD
jgi:hypothetical protein